MVELFANRYRVESSRLRSWDYAGMAMYFITICTRYRENYFGAIVSQSDCRDAMLGVSADLPVDGDGDAMPGVSAGTGWKPTEMGRIAAMEWFKTPELRRDINLELGEFVVMPNHIHGIMIIGNNKYNTPERGRDAMPGVSADLRVDGDRDARHGVSTIDSGMDRDARHGVSTNQFGPQSKNLASVIRGYKSSVTTYARKNNIEFGWQPRFHDHIIRSMDEHHRIANYIRNNPAKWWEDKFHRK